MQILFLFSLLNLALGKQELYKNKFLTFFSSTEIYLKLEGFKKGDKLYFEVSCPKRNCPLIYYSESNVNSVPIENTNMKTLITSTYSENYLFSIILTENYNFLLFKIIGLNENYTIRHYGSDNNDSSSSVSNDIKIIIIVGGGFVFIACLALIILWCYKKVTNPPVNMINEPLKNSGVQSSVYIQPVYPITYQIQPAYPY